jgi:hypothetical protein
MDTSECTRRSDRCRWYQQTCGVHLTTKPTQGDNGAGQGGHNGRRQHDDADEPQHSGDNHGPGGSGHEGGQGHNNEDDHANSQGAKPSFPC